MFTNPLRTVIGSLLGIACSTVLVATASAQQRFPDKPITMIVPFAAGGAVDVTTRIICEEAEKALGQKILIVNKAGGGATEGQGFVARAKPDGYTLLAGSSSIVTNTITKNVDYTVDSFETIALYNYDPDVMMVPTSEPYKTIEELMAAAKKEPLSSVTSGHSTAHHIAYLLLENAAGVKFKYVHTKGGSEAVPMVAGGHAKTLLGAWDGEAPAAAGLIDFRQRIAAYMQKAIKEAKVHTSWVNPNEAYDDAVEKFVAQVLARENGDAESAIVVVLRPIAIARGNEIRIAVAVEVGHGKCSRMGRRTVGHQRIECRRVVGEENRHRSDIRVIRDCNVGAAVTVEVGDHHCGRL